MSTDKKELEELLNSLRSEHQADMPLRDVVARAREDLLKIRNPRCKRESCVRERARVDVLEDALAEARRVKPVKKCERAEGGKLAACIHTVTVLVGTAKACATCAPHVETVAALLGEKRATAEDLAQAERVLRRVANWLGSGTAGPEAALAQETQVRECPEVNAQLGEVRWALGLIEEARHVPSEFISAATAARRALEHVWEWLALADEGPEASLSEAAEVQCGDLGDVLEEEARVACRALGGLRAPDEMAIEIQEVQLAKQGLRKYILGTSEGGAK